MPKETTATVKAEGRAAMAALNTELIETRKMLADALALAHSRQDAGHKLVAYGDKALDELRALETRNALLLGFILAKVPTEEVPDAIYGSR